MILVSLNIYKLNFDNVLKSCIFIDKYRRTNKQNEKKKKGGLWPYKKICNLIF